MARLHSPSAVPLPGGLVRVLDWLKAHLDDPIDLDCLAAIAEVKPRTLEAHFRDFLGTTPLAWVRRLRLANARRQLQDGGRSASVTAIALANGFGQFGRFAAQYRETYGELPSQTLKRTVAAAEVDDEAIFLASRAVPAAFSVAPEQCDQAIEDASRALERAPDYGLATAVLAWCIGQRSAHNFNGVVAATSSRAVDLARTAAKLGSDDAMTLTLVSSALNLAHRLGEADRVIERAVAIEPASPFVWLRRGWLSAYAGDSDSAIRELRLVLRMMPFEPLRHVAFIGIGCAHFAAGRYDRAARWIREGVDSHPGSFWANRVAVAAAVHGGTAAEARRIARRVLRQEPHLTVAMARNAWPFPTGFVDRLCDGLKAAGVPRH